MCDQIFDPQNFGAILRCGECFGADGVVWSKNRGSDLTPVVAKSSCGATEWTSLIRISNLAEGVALFQENGYEVLATAFDENSKNAFEYKFAPKTVIVLGSEGEGIQPLILKKADQLLHIPMSGKIQSLNVAQAASSMLTCYRIKNPK
jgi:23S rRNA (guanosine2251-2'-O)-methyltransferase